MSILIKGMKMPESGYIDIRLHTFADGKQCATIDEYPYPFNRKFEVVEVPKHGRLIDADKMITRFENINDFLMGGCEFSELASSDKARVDELANCIAEIVNAPTVIDTEGDKHDV